MQEAIQDRTGRGLRQLGNLLDGTVQRVAQHEYQPFSLGQSCEAIAQIAPNVWRGVDPITRSEYCLT